MLVVSSPTGKTVLDLRWLSLFKLDFILDYSIQCVLSRLVINTQIKSFGDLFLSSFL